jgi:3-oxoacyl-[acyl-carrier protein] reductase
MSEHVVESVALVTGASRGIGAAIAARLAGRGLRVAVQGRTESSRLAATLASLPGGGHACFVADLAEPGAPARLIDSVLARFDRIDVLVNNAAVYELHSPGSDDFEEWERAWRRTMAVDLEAPAHLSFLAARRMRRQGGGRIVNISSRGAFRGEANAPAYGAAKAGLNALGQSMAKALAPSGVLVFTVAPGWVETEMAAPHLHGARREEILGDIPLGRVASADEIAGIAAWLALDAPASMTGCIVDANGASYLRT